MPNWVQNEITILEGDTDAVLESICGDERGSTSTD